MNLPYAGSMPSVKWVRQGPRCSFQKNPEQAPWVGEPENASQTVMESPAASGADSARPTELSD